MASTLFLRTKTSGDQRKCDDRGPAAVVARAETLRDMQSARRAYCTLVPVGEGGLK